MGYEIVTQCTTYQYNTPFAIPDNAPGFTVKIINVPTTGIIDDVNIHVDVTHPNIQNLNIAVIRPGGPLTNIFNQQCAGSADLDVTFDADGTAFTCGSPTAGTYIPPTGIDLNAFEGFNQQGNWQFGFRDLVAGDTGTVNSISVEVCTRVINLATHGFDLADFSLYPNPNAGDFTVHFNSGSGNQIGIVVTDMSGRKVMDKSYPDAGTFSQQIHLGNIQSGIYIVSVSDGQKKVTRKIVKQ